MNNAHVFIFKCSETDRTFRGNRHHSSSGSAVNHGQVQYVQPVKLVAHGAPIAAVPLGNNYQPPRTTTHQSSYNAPKPQYGPPKRPSTGYGAPSYTPSAYDAPKPSYNAPSYEAPKPSYGAPSYEAPKAPSYKAPSYEAPKPSYSAPTYEAPKAKPSYKPRPSYNAPKPSYGAPSSYDAPTAIPSYSAPKYDLLTPGSAQDRYQV